MTFSTRSASRNASTDARVVSVWAAKPCTARDGLHQELREGDPLVDELLDGRDGRVDRSVARGDRHAFVVAEFQYNGGRRNKGSGGHLQEFECDRLFADAVDVAY